MNYNSLVTIQQWKCTSLFDGLRTWEQIEFLHQWLLLAVAYNKRSKIKYEDFKLILLVLKELSVSITEDKLIFVYIPTLINMMLEHIKIKNYDKKQMITYLYFHCYSEINKLSHKFTLNLKK